MEALSDITYKDYYDDSKAAGKDILPLNLIRLILHFVIAVNSCKLNFI
jgi:hypothetical protein